MKTCNATNPEYMTYSAQRCSFLNVALPNELQFNVTGLGSAVNSLNQEEEFEDKLSVLFWIQDEIRASSKLANIGDTPYGLFRFNEALWSLVMLPDFRRSASFFVFSMEGDKCGLREMFFSLTTEHGEIDPSQYVRSYRVEKSDKIGARASVMEIMRRRLGDNYEHHLFFPMGLFYLEN